MRCPCGCGLDKPALSGWKPDTSFKTECVGCGKFLSGDHDATRVSHGICNDCLRRLYPEYAEEIIRELENRKGGSNEKS